MKGAKIIFFLLLIAGLAVALFPVGSGLVTEHQMSQQAEAFMRRTEILPSFTEAVLSTSADAPLPYQDLLDAMQEYNEQLYANGQSALTSPAAYQEAALDVTAYGLDDGIVGVVSIPKLDIELPIYLGATSENLAAGAAVLGQTTLPIGGENTNCVIAAHRGWRGADYFRHLDELEIGDTVSITNLWYTIGYRVCSVRVIEPDDIGAILIQDGRDLLTLITCHPYASGGKYRLAVYCERNWERRTHGSISYRKDP